jgi:hypothetical protein
VHANKTIYKGACQTHRTPPAATPGSGEYRHVDGDIALSAIPHTQRGYREDAQRVDLLKRATVCSRLECDADSGSDAETDATDLAIMHIQKTMHQRSYGAGVCVVGDKERCIGTTDTELIDRARALCRNGHVVFAAGELGVSLRNARRCVALCEVLPRWFALASELRSTADARRAVCFLRESLSDSDYHTAMDEHIAQHPLPHTSVSNVVQNMRGRAFCYIVLLYHVRANGGRVEGEVKMLRAIPPAMLDALRLPRPAALPSSRRHGSLTGAAAVLP